jgi:anti-sigma factor RsiW
MDCKDAGPMIAAAADDALEPARRAHLDAHVGACPACRAALVDQRMVRTVLSSMPASAPSPNFLARVNARIDEASGWFGLTDFRVWTLRLVPAAAALALVGFLGLPAALGITTSSDTPAKQTAQAPDARVTGATFSPASLADWQRDVTPDALLDAALRTSAGEPHVR